MRAYVVFYPININTVKMQGIILFGNSEFDIFVKFIKKRYRGLDWDLIDILDKYYGVHLDDIYINHMRDAILKKWGDPNYKVQSFLNDEKSRKAIEMFQIEWEKPKVSFIDKIRSGDKEFLKFAYRNRLYQFYIISIENKKYIIITIDIILKKIKNNDYKHIWRLFNYS